MDISFLFGFLTGSLATALGGWQVQKFMNNRKNVATIKKKKILDLDRLFHDFPHFMSIIKNDVNNPSYKSVREFFVVDKDAILNSPVPRFRYELSTEILPALDRLEELGYIEKLKNNCLHYKIEEEFIMQLQSIAITAKE
ncbi:Uncharacterised protein [Legionella steigerwaltii]|uniref:Uncharacterized protein n=1 Tax=Legionella steigerwaltii TaxID=460 RepID=A0A378LA44_9GAMM|nr:hypothetical protein [Legionella steigerwaltii]KTD75349.1 hypothetical protein Lstg_2524 [Legionella steigerwaltii]STY23706.1 Uncharacterised protein [Legionella steigerwaltii]